MKASLKSKYVSKAGNPTFVYRVSGTPQELAALKVAKGEFYREDEDGTPLLFATRAFINPNDLTISQTGKIVSNDSKIQAQASIIAQLGGNLGQALAAEVAKSTFSSITVAESTPVEAPAEIESETK